MLRKVTNEKMVTTVLSSSDGEDAPISHPEQNQNVTELLLRFPTNSILRLNSDPIWPLLSR